MNKHLFAAAAIMMGVAGMSAQTQVLKDAERAIKDGKSPAEVVAIITPAFSDPETQSNAQTYYIPGKSLFGEYDQLYALKQFNKLPEGGDIIMADDLVAGYGFYMTALPLDSVVDAKGKVKTKYSKDIINTLAGHVNDYHTAALAYWEVKNFNGAYDAWQIYIDMVDNPVIAAKMNNVPADTIIGEIAFNQGVAAWQADSLANALKSFELAKSKGFTKKTVYDYALAVAQGLGDTKKMYEIALEAQPIYGKEDPMYIGCIINYYLQEQQFDQAFQMIDEAIANDPTNAQYHFVKGILYDNQEKTDEAKAEFYRAIELDPENSAALYQYGRMLCNEAYVLSDSAPNTPAESEKFYYEKLVPMYQEAAGYLERAWAADNDNVDALNALYTVYYNLHDEAKMEDVEARKLQ